MALHLGATALLDCRVAMLAGKKVRFVSYRKIPIEVSILLKIKDF